MIQGRNDGNHHRVELLDKTFSMLVDTWDASKSCTSCFVDHELATILVYVVLSSRGIIYQPDCSLNFISSSLIFFDQGGVSFIGILAKFSELFVNV